jgi:GT2 family glycosyltransferase
MAEVSLPRDRLVCAHNTGVRVAVLIVNYRAYDALERCLASLRQFTGDDDEVVVVDWESDAQVREPLAASYPWVRFLPSAANLGFSAGVNKAASATTAPMLLLLNPDTEVQGPIVRVLSSWLEAHPEAGVVGPRVLNTDGTIQPSARRYPGLSTVLGGRSTWLTRRYPGNWFSRRNLLHIASDAASESRRVDWLTGACFATPRRVFERLSGLDESFFMYWEDADYCRRVNALGLTCHHLPTTAVSHIGGASSAHRQVASIRAFHRSAFWLYWKHSRFGRAAAPLVWIGLRVRAEIKVALLRE